MHNTGHVQKTRLVVNSNYDLTTGEKLSSLSVQQCVRNFNLDITMAARKDHRSYVQVVVGKCDSNYMSHHKVHSDTGKQYSNSTQGLSAHWNTTTGLNHKQGRSMFTKSAEKQVKVTLDLVADKDLYVV